MGDIWPFHQDDGISIDVYGNKSKIRIRLGEAAETCGLPMHNVGKVMQTICERYLYFNRYTPHLRKDLPPIQHQQSAEVIQKNIRGYLTRRKLDKNPAKNLIHREIIMNIPVKENGTNSGKTENFVCSVFYDKQKATLELWSTTRKDTMTCDVDGPDLKNLLTMLILSKQVPHLRIDEEKPYPRTMTVQFSGGRMGSGTVHIRAKSL